MTTLQPSVYRETAVHAVAWLSYILVQVLAIDQFEHHYIANMLAALAQLPAQLLFTYLTLYWLIPTYLLTRQYIRFGLLTSLGLLAGGVLYWEGTYFLYLTPFRSRTTRPGKSHQPGHDGVMRFLSTLYQ